MQISTESVGPCLEALEARLLLSAFDLRDSGDVTDVRNQGTTYQSCWAFATYGSLESSILVEGGSEKDFSENNLMNCNGFTGEYGPTKGGSYLISEAYLSRGSGPIKDTADVYPVDEEESVVRPLPSSESQYYVREMLRYDTVEEIKYAVEHKGALYTEMYWDEYTGYRSSDHTYYSPLVGQQNNHAVTIVGWKDDKDTPASSNGAWLVKNSYGDEFGENGYFWVSYADPYACKFAESFSGAAGPEVYGNVYKHDDYGQVWQLAQSTAMNAFNAVASEPLKAVGFFTLMDNAMYTVKVYTTFPNSTQSNYAYTTNEAGTTLATRGWHTVDLGTPVQLTEGNTFYVSVSLSNAGSTPMAVDMKLPDTWNSSAAAGESYYLSGGQWHDLTLDYSYSTANFCIKALTGALSANIVDVSPDPCQTSINSIAITFSEGVTGFNLSDLTLSREGSPNLLTGSQTLSSDNQQNNAWTLSGLSGITDKAGRYELKLTAANSDIKDTSGYALIVDASDTWIMNAVNTSTGNDTVKLSRDGSLTKVDINNGSVVYWLDPAGFPILNVNTDGGDDTLTVDFSAGNPVPAAGLTFAADGGTSDILKIIGTSGADTLDYTTTQAVLYSSGINATVTFTGVEKHQADLDGGSDTVEIVGTSGNDTFTVANAESLNVSLGEGNDTLNLVGGVYTFATGDFSLGAGEDMLRVTDATVTLNDNVGASATDDSDTVETNGAAELTFNVSQHLKALELNGSSVVSLGGTHKVLVTDSLVIAEDEYEVPTARLDIGDGLLVINYEGDSPMQTIRDLIIAAFNSYQWDGNGIGSKTMAADPSSIYGIGYADNNQLPAPFGEDNPFGDTEDVATNAILVRYTLIGDVDLNGIVDDTDILFLTNNYLSLVPDWFGGDVFGYDGIVDDADVLFQANNYLSSV